MSATGQLVECAPLRAQLSRKACVHRWRLAGGANPRGRTARLIAAVQSSACRGCLDGRRRSAGEPDAARAAEVQQR